MTRRALLALAAALPACSVLPERPYQEPQRFVLAPERPAMPAPGRPAVPAPARRGPVLLLRTLRAAPGLEQRGLRVLGPAGVVTYEFWSEWTAPPADLAEEALRRWLVASGRFGAVTAPGSRLRSDLILEGELTRLQAEPANGLARAALSALLLADGTGESRVLGQFLVEGTAALPGGPRGDGRIVPAEAAAAMTAALGTAFGRLEGALAGSIPRR
ncbi:ABC-type transport auxiliary lipoprotein family protein [Paracraurococcus lichenis]|uniref:ABC-type transport auxiliary lipoprotein family protein n=1 Tax=Paracraurococcus lichenis TaxID=3064888 RepID=A0ABT9DYS9_9PROT|nr:ABC-type transport auxiliary lipoprotein family protein [Paracraurococcus sp. LOR1-02]MDO9709059.1 ABC-type transport auxiliary lipoprotein family protein [Paracraurococcus sp. LOR1-02]